MIIVVLIAESIERNNAFWTYAASPIRSDCQFAHSEQDLRCPLTESVDTIEGMDV